MSNTAAEQTGATAPTAATAATAGTPSYTIVGSYSTVQVLTATEKQDVQAFTIQTSPSGVIASLPLDKVDFDAGTSGPLLQGFAQAIEAVMAYNGVIEGVGDQTRDVSGLIRYEVVFTVQYVGPNTAPSGVTALATVPVGLLSTVETFGGRTNLPQAYKIIDGVLANLKAAAGG